MSRRAELRELPIALAGDAGAPLHKRLYDGLRAAILEGRLGPRAALPSSRDLAGQLGVARGTVVAVYEQLAGEGYLDARTGSGTRVAEALPDRWFRAPPRREPGPRAAKGPPLSRFGR